MDTSRVSSKLYRQIDVWERETETSAIRYRCFEVLGENKFCVQSSDYYYYPGERSAQQRQDLDEQFLEFFLETPPDERDKVYDSIEEAIQAHQRDFEDV